MLAWRQTCMQDEAKPGSDSGPLASPRLVTHTQVRLYAITGRVAESRHADRPSAYRPLVGSPGTGPRATPDAPHADQSCDYRPSVGSSGTRPGATFCGKVRCYPFFARCSPKTSRRALATWPSVAPASSASFIGGSRLSVPCATARTLSRAGSTAARSWLRL